MTISSFGKATVTVIILTACTFLALFASGVRATPTLMAPWSALAFSIIGFTLWIAPNPRVERFAIHCIGAILVFALGAVVSAEHIQHAGSTAFDQFLFPTQLPRNSLLPGRPAPLAGFRYCLLGVMLAFLGARRRGLVVVREWTAMAIITLCYFGLVAALSSWGTNAPQSISPFAAILGILAAANVLTMAPNGLLVPLLRDKGPAGLIARSLMPVALILPAITLTLRQLLTHVPVDDSRRPDGILFASVHILAALVIVWIGASKVLSIDSLRRKAEDEVRASRDDLDHRVQLRTQELLDANERLAIEATSRERAQNELQQSNAMLGSLIEACPLAITAFGLDGSVRKSNAAAHGMHLGDNPECRALAERASRGEPVDAAELVCQVDGKAVHLQVWASPILTNGARPDGVVMMAADVSESRALEAHIQQNQRLESLGVLAGGIAHDFNNLLTGVLGNASFLLDRFSSGSREAKAASDLITAGQVMAKLTSQMLAYSGRGYFQIRPLNLSDEVRQITNLLQASIPKNVRLNLTLEEGLPAIEGDSSQIQQVVMNLVINGAEAVGSEQGAVEVRTLVRRAEQSELASGVTQPPAPAGVYVVLEVRDTGIGMDQRTRARIFDPFFTTKFTGRGLGLSAVLGIVRAHHGALVVQSCPGSGSAFRVFFPCSVAHQLVSPPQRATAAAQQGLGTILVVDDEELVLSMAQSVLNQAGYHVLRASNGSAALDIYAARSAEIDAIVLDMTMPVMGGEETMKHLAARWPEAVVVATSGYDLQDAGSCFAIRPAGFLQKPYTAAQLASKVAEVIRSRAQPPT
jgi:signal transduction histidine kinase/ActR/RegA family two-component response regulator